jgi:hypothetical protein|tara:strand:+ start:5 stop:187 length:183 start_codon:yes stop_codon:yes gene_type:complete
MALSDPTHPIWKLARVFAVCGVLLTLQLLTATSYDLQLDGEAGTLAGVVLIQTLLEWTRK